MWCVIYLQTGPMSDLQLQYDQQLVIVEQLKEMIREQEDKIKKQDKELKVNNFGCLSRSQRFHFGLSSRIIMCYSEHS